MSLLHRMMVIFGFVLSLAAFGQDSATQELGTGSTRLVARSRGLDASIVLHTKDISAKSLLGERFVEGQIRDTVRVCSELIISVNKRRIFVPRSTFSDLVGVRKAEITVEGNMGALRIYGGDASESFVVRIDFDKTKVMRRALFSSSFDRKPLEQTTYHMRVMEDRP